MLLMNAEIDVVVLVAALVVEERPLAGRHRARARAITGPSRGCADGRLEDVERVSARRRRRSGRSPRARPRPARRRAPPRRGARSRPASSSVERIELEQLAAREERRVHLEVGVLGGRADERDEAGLDRRQERVLLALVEPVDLVEEEDRALPVRAEPVARLRRARGGRRRRRSAPPRAPRSGPGCVWATIRARVVLPLPGGPKKIIDGTRSEAIARRRALPSPTTPAWPTNSSIVPRSQPLCERGDRREPRLGGVREEVADLAESTAPYRVPSGR